MTKQIDLSAFTNLGDAEVRALTAIASELNSAIGTYPAFASAHEGHSILREEYLELEREVFRKKRSRQSLSEEAAQVGAMAARFLTDVVYREKPL